MVRVVGVVLASLWWSGCGPQVDGDVVAKIGDEEIELVDLRQFREESTANYRDPEEGLQAWRFYLQTMIDMKLMLIDGAGAAVGSDSGIRAPMGAGTAQETGR